MRNVKPRSRNLRKTEPFVGNAAWHAFVDWCQRNKLTAVPANAWTLAAYIRSLEGTESLPKLRKRVADIGKAHAEKSKRRPERDPLIAKTFQIIKQRAEKKAVDAGLFDDQAIAHRQTAAKRHLPESAETGKNTDGRQKSRGMRSQPRLVRKRQLGRR